MNLDISSHESKSLARRQTGKLAVAVVAVLSLVLGLTVASGTPEASAASSNPYLFWINWGEGNIGRSLLNGTSSNPDFKNADYPYGVVATGTHVYWSEPGNNRIGRMKVDGSEYTPNFIAAAEPLMLAVHGGHIYWSRNGAGFIGRAALSGANKDENFVKNVPNSGSIYGLAVTDQFIFWANYTDSQILRANYDGSGVTPIIDLPYQPMGLVAQGSYIYWSKNVVSPDVVMGRARLDASDRNDEHIKFQVPDAHVAEGLASDDKNLYLVVKNMNTAYGASIYRTGLTSSNATAVVSNLVSQNQTDLTIAPSVQYPTPARTSVAGFDFLSPSKTRVRTTAPADAASVQYRFRSNAAKTYSSWRASKSKSSFDVSFATSKGGWVQVRSVSAQGAVSEPMTAFTRAQVKWVKSGRCQAKPKSIRYSGTKATVAFTRKSGSCLRWRETRKNSSRYLAWKKVRSAQLKTINLGSKAGAVQVKAGRNSLTVWTYLPRS